MTAYCARRRSDDRSSAYPRARPQRTDAAAAARRNTRRARTSVMAAPGQPDEQEILKAMSDDRRPQTASGGEKQAPVNKTTRRLGKDIQAAECHVIHTIGE